MSAEQFATVRAFLFDQDADYVAARLALDSLEEQLEDAERKWQIGAAAIREFYEARIAELEGQLEAVRSERDDELLTERQRVRELEEQLEVARKALVDIENLLPVDNDPYDGSANRAIREAVERGLDSYPATSRITVGPDPFSGEPGTSTSAGGSWGNSAGGSFQDTNPKKP